MIWFPDSWSRTFVPGAWFRTFVLVVRSLSFLPFFLVSSFLSCAFLPFLCLLFFSPFFFFLAGAVATDATDCQYTVTVQKDPSANGKLKSLLYMLVVLVVQLPAPATL
jgi:hypothetical protein